MFSSSGLFLLLAELRDAIRDAIPMLIQLLKDDSLQARSAAASSLAKMAEQGEFWPDVFELWLIHIVSGAS